MINSIAMNRIECNKSLQQLDGEDWGEPTFDSHLVVECHRLRRVPLREFTAGNLRILIGQQMSLVYLVPMALELLRFDPLIEGDYYAGDLLAALLRVEGAFWGNHPELRREATAVATQAFGLLPKLDEIDRQTAAEAITAAYDVFKKSETAKT